MRKLIIASIITVFLLIAWMCYIHYDTQRFIEELAQELPPKIQVNRATKSDSDPLEPRQNDETIQTEQEHTHIDNFKEIDEDSVLPLESDTDIKDRMGTLDFGNMPESNLITPEIEELFIEYNNLWQQSIEVSKVLAPLINRTIEVNKRLLVIGQELSAARDEDTKRKVLSEWEAIDKWIEEIKPKVTILEEEAELLSNKRLSLVSEYGFSSEDDFLKTHEMVYRTWLSDQEQ